MALNAPISSDATPLNQPSAHQLGGLQKQAEFKERLQPAGRTERKKTLWRRAVTLWTKAEITGLTPTLTPYASLVA